MAETDALFQRIFWYCMMPVIGFYAIIRSLKKHIVIWYGKLFAWMMDKMTKKVAHKMRPRKLKLFCELHDVAAANLSKGLPFKIVEIGSGTGANFEYYPKGTNVLCVDPNPNYSKYLQKNARNFPDITLEAVQCGAEDMTRIHDNSVDAVVGTLVLCSVNDVTACLREIKRILKPGAKYFYFEHVAAQTGSLTHRTQKFLQRLHRKLADNCNTCQETKSYIEAGEFSSLDHEQYWAHEIPKLLFIMKTILIGKATK